MTAREGLEPATVSFRPAVPADVDRIVALVESAYRGDASRAGWTTEAHLNDGQRTDAGQVEALLGRPDSLVLLAETEDPAGTGPAAPPGAAATDTAAGATILGCCHVERTGPGTAYFGMFAVRPRLQGRGVGRSLLARAAATAAGWGCPQMRMTVIRQRPDLLAWYARLGFEPTGETEPFPYGDERFGRPRRDDLEFVVLAGPTDGPARNSGTSPTLAGRS